MVTVKVSVPTPSSELAANLLGALGLAGAAVAVGGLTGNWWWSLLVASLMLVGLAYVAQAHAAAEQAEQQGPAVAATVPSVVDAAAAVRAAEQARSA